MTDGSLTGDGPAQQPSGGGLAGAVAPEGVAGIIAIIVVVILLASRLTLSGGLGAAATPTPSPSEAPAPPPSAGIDLAAIATLREVNAHLETQAAALNTVLKTAPVSTDAIREALRPMSQELNLVGLDAAARLAASRSGAKVGKEVRNVYQILSDQIGMANTLALANVKGWTAGGVAILKTLALLPTLDDELEALRLSETSPSASASVDLGASPSPSTSAAPSPSASVISPTPSKPPPASPTPTPTPVPSVSPSSSPALGPNLIVDGSFETGVGLPWQLVLSDQAVATVASDPVGPHSPAAAAHIDISVPSSRQISIAYQQSGFPVEAGAFYRVSIALRSTDSRDVRIRIADVASSQILDSRVFTVGPLWTVETYDITSLIGSTSAVFSVDVGRSSLAVWVDDISLARIPPH